MNSIRVFTIGGYGHDERGFVQTLRDAHIDLLVDIRQRRGVRGARYAFLNSARLQALLKTAGIGYLYAQPLAPTTEIRAEQKAADAATSTSKRDRTALAPRFVDSYNSRILANFGFDDFLAQVQPARALAFFCVEESASACHRSLVAQALGDRIGAPVEHLRACRLSSSQ